jgi:putative methanogen marker protein 4
MFNVKDLLQTEQSGIRVGIGRGTDTGRVERSVCAMNNKNVKIYDDPKKLVDDLYSGAIDAAVRGDMSSSELLQLLKEKAGVDHLERLVIMEPRTGSAFFMAPVGVDEGWTVKEKYEITVKAVKLMKEFGTDTKIAVMSGGRIDDRGRNKVVDKTLDEAEELVSILQKEGYDAYNGEILIEAVAEEADLVIAPNGITGNLIFRTLHFLGDAVALGAPVLNIDRVFVDTSRVKTDYMDSIILAMKLAEGKK